MGENQPDGCRVVIVGGVAGGMSCAARLRRLEPSARITVLERGPHVSFANCGLPYYVGGEIADPAALLLHTPDTLRAALDLDVRAGHEAIALDAEAKRLTVATPDGETEIGYDELVLAPGARAAPPPVPGLADSTRVHTLRSVGDALRLRAAVEGGARRAVVLGAGFIGLEGAEALRGQGLAVDVVELAPHVLPPFEPELAFLAAEELRRLGMAVHEGTAARVIEPGPGHDRVILDGGVQIEADLILVAAGVRPDTEIFEAAGVACERGAIVADAHGRTSLPHVWAVGDATAAIDAVSGARRPAALAGPANRAGRLVADAIAAPGQARPIPPPVGTAIVRLGALTCALTGANRRTLTAAGIAHTTVHLHPLDHAGYFPGAQPMRLVAHFADDDGRLLGAQGAGPEGVARRIDVLATAIRAGMAVEDLIDLDLAYSPPYGQAKDAVNLIGMAGQNARAGLLRLWYAEDVADVLASALVLDVRSAAEFATGHLPGALNIAHTELRGRLAEVRAAAGGRAVRVMCATGARSYLAHRVLDGAGFDSATLSGGVQTLRAARGIPAGGADLMGASTP
jgi:NADPH-dependent 2,4-dienoyl-CoA reductase/sulfur reductase-like enzyme/rhodanese-related sulfurtransferase